jgi:hypothetical protein
MPWWPSTWGLCTPGSNYCINGTPYILKSNPHPFYSFRGLKNQMRITIACGLDLRSRAGFWKNDGVAVHAVRTIQYNNLLFYLLLIIIYYSWDSLSSLVTESLSVLRWDGACLLRKAHFTVLVWLNGPRRSIGFNTSVNIRYYSTSRPVGKGRLKERCGLEAQTNFFPFKKSPKT